MDVVKPLVSATTRYALRSQYNFLRERGPLQFAKLNALLIDSAVRERLNRSAYRMLDERQLASARRSDTVFIFGSGYSLNDITAAQWQHIAGHDTFGFTSFIYQHWVRVDYHLIRGGVEHVLGSRPFAEDFCRTLNANPLFADTCFILQGEYRAMFANQILGHRWLRPGARVYRYRTAPESGLPTSSLQDGVRHTGGTLGDAVNMAACLGWKHIVLAGVDLYDSRYFWLRPDETLEFDPATGLLKPGTINARGHRPDEPHNTARNGVVEMMGQWRQHLERDRGIRMSVLNPRSLLANVMPLYRPPL
ncbi:MAG: hypothetical protein A3F69_02320 [Acidobacteria bacterium RIFCSPLOWO2_12_FULL_66_10]|nr:MAG: hypothetical protein A3F69_02320 [Acidobacteria bacterium RIFCSPLOWO2_12_FULL_66_10]